MNGRGESVDGRNGNGALKPRGAGLKERRPKSRVANGQLEQQARLWEQRQTRDEE